MLNVPGIILGRVSVITMYVLTTIFCSLQGLEERRTLAKDQTNSLNNFWTYTIHRMMLALPPSQVELSSFHYKFLLDSDLGTSIYMIWKCLWFISMLHFLLWCQWVIADFLQVPVEESSRKVRCVCFDQYLFYYFIFALFFVVLRYWIFIFICWIETVDSEFKFWMCLVFHFLILSYVWRQIVPWIQGWSCGLSWLFLCEMDQYE